MTMVAAAIYICLLVLILTINSANAYYIDHESALREPEVRTDLVESV